MSKDEALLVSSAHYPHGGEAWIVTIPTNSITPTENSALSVAGVQGIWWCLEKLHNPFTHAFSQDKRRKMKCHLQMAVCRGRNTTYVKRIHTFTQGKQMNKLRHTHNSQHAGSSCMRNGKEKSILIWSELQNRWEEGYDWCKGERSKNKQYYRALPKEKRL